MTNIIVAISNNRVIGKDNQLLWRMPADLKYFKSLTLGYPIIMGRKTFESIGKPLPGRLNIVVTRNPSALRFQPSEILIFDSLEEAIASAKKHDNEIFIIGGGEIYKQALPFTNRIYLTKVDTEVEGDTFFPELTDEWQIESEQHFKADEKNPFNYSFLIYHKRPN